MTKQYHSVNRHPQKQRSSTPTKSDPHTDSDTTNSLADDHQILQLQRVIGNQATLQYLQRSHGKGCGCSACRGGRVQREAQEESEQHGPGCGCGSCGHVQRKADALQRDDVPADPKMEAMMYYRRILGGEQVYDESGPTVASITAELLQSALESLSPKWKPKEKKEKKATKSEVLDLLQAQLSATQFAKIAAILMLKVPGSVVESEEARERATEILEIQLQDKGIARRLLDQGTTVVVIPKNKKMTDVVEFQSLAGTQTFDGRTWDEVRGSGGFKVPGKKAIYVAISEENTVGSSAEGDASGTQWCYAAGYSVTSHEFAHVVDRFGLDDADRALVDDEYNKKVQARTDWETKYKEALRKRYHPTSDRRTKREGRRELKALEATRVEWIDGYDYIARNGTTTRTYASVHRLEYFAQSANAYFGTNGGNDPYVVGLWSGKGKADKAKRRNGKGDVQRLEPELFKLFKRIFGDKNIEDANKARPKPKK